MELKNKAHLFLRFLLLGLLFVIFSGCSSIKPPSGTHSRTVMVETTGYCPCGKCCGWRRSRLPPFHPIYSYGPLEGQRKKVGVTATGTKAGKGTIAADTNYYSFGTVMEIPGYGKGRVEDRGGDIKGSARIDLFFKTHKQALEWGRQRVPVQVWR